MKSSNFILFTSFLAISICMNAQTIEGNYQVEDIQMAVADIGITYSFKPDGTFRETIHEHLDHKTYQEELLN
ncbi:hypothetical protein LZ575_19715 [Antarcticibacterium sp. 1MA-6-2]|uniref:hypothetical protein n=1 Tax=Antarcticibacterium sp. 1MA-6-2 TaxID=2908210 RepID=UPI001F20FAB4|nr:hypothetical protein [Antarcticibacterium sp. 1MA-6-2]UJH90901.1 hypothetical protein LZ575_19715 [Antarcticibacterium sp. 1MA-6-2]